MVSRTFESRTIISSLVTFNMKLKVAGAKYGVSKLTLQKEEERAGKDLLVTSIEFHIDLNDLENIANELLLMASLVRSSDDLQLVTYSEKYCQYTTSCTGGDGETDSQAD